jgi:RimJ/RimL family protein N-acetyltransferase
MRQWRAASPALERTRTIVGAHFFYVGILHTVMRPAAVRSACISRPTDGLVVTVPFSIETPRLLLRPFRDTDIEAYAAMCADPEVMRYVGERGPLSRGDAWRQMAMLVGHWQLRGFGMWAVEERATGAFLGRVGLHFPDGWPDREVA